MVGEVQKKALLLRFFLFGKSMVAVFWYFGEVDFLHRIGRDLKVERKKDDELAISMECSW